MPTHPWKKWFPADWLADPCLSKCSPATRGIWMDALCVMMHTNGCQIEGSTSDIARLCRCTLEELGTALHELKRTKTAEIRVCHGRVTVTCRRLQREVKERNQATLRKRRQRALASVTPESPKCHTNPSEYAYAYASNKGEVKGGEKDHKILPADSPLNPHSDRKATFLVKGADNVLTVMRDLLGSKGTPIVDEEREPVMAALSAGYKQDDLVAVVKHQYRLCRDDSRSMCFFVPRYLFALDKLGARIGMARRAGFCGPAKGEADKSNVNLQPPPPPTEEQKAAFRRMIYSMGIRLPSGETRKDNT